MAWRRGGGLPRQRRGAERDPRTTSADQCPRPVGTTDAKQPPHLAPSASPTPPRPRLLGGAGIRDRGGACVPLSRLSDGIGHRPRPHKPCLQRAAAPGWRTHPAGGQLVRRRPRAIRAAPPAKLRGPVQGACCRMWFKMKRYDARDTARTCYPSARKNAYRLLPCVSECLLVSLQVASASWQARVH